VPTFCDKSRNHAAQLSVKCPNPRRRVMNRQLFLCEQGYEYHINLLAEPGARF